MNKADLMKLVRPLPDAVWQADFFLAHLDASIANLYPGMAVNMTPDFQRGHVWTDEQRLKFCEAFVRRFIPGHLLTFQFNCPFWNEDKLVTDLPREVQCIDGLQRLTSLRMMMAGEIKPFGVTVDAFDGTPLQINRIGRTVKIQMHAFTTKRDLLRYYLDLNEGATPHTEAEIGRIWEMLAALK